MGTTQLEVYNIALKALGPVRLASLVENRPDRRELDEVYARSLQLMLERAVWRYALRASMMEADPDIDPSFGLPYAFGLPDDFVRLHAITIDELMDVEDRSFRREGSVIYSQHSVLYWSYVSNDDAFGGDLGKMTGLFAKAFGLTLAEEACVPITSDQNLQVKVMRMRSAAVSEAKRLEAVDERVKAKPMGSWLAARFGSTSDARRNGRE